MSFVLALALLGQAATPPGEPAIFAAHSDMAAMALQYTDRCRVYHLAHGRDRQPESVAWALATKGLPKDEENVFTVVCAGYISGWAVGVEDSATVAANNAATQLGMARAARRAE